LDLTLCTLMTARASVRSAAWADPADDGQYDLAAGLAAHAFDGVVQGHALDQCVVELDDQVAALDACLKGWGVSIGEITFTRPSSMPTFDAQSAEFALRADLQFLEGFCVEEGE